METAAQSGIENKTDVYESLLSAMPDLIPQIENVKHVISNIEIKQNGGCGGEQGENESQLKAAIKILPFLLEFLQNPRKNKITKFVLAKIITFVEYLAPAMEALSVYKTIVDARIDKCVPTRFEQDNKMVTTHLIKLKVTLGKLTCMIEKAADKLEESIQVCSSVANGGQADN